MDLNILGSRKKYYGLKIESTLVAKVSWKNNVKTSKSYVGDDLAKRSIHFTIDEEAFKAFDEKSVLNYDRIDRADGFCEGFVEVNPENFCFNFDGLTSLLCAEKSREWNIKFTISGYCGCLIITNWEVID